ncbi:O-methyltransferase [Effusibacillus lacus]|uniref:tRNA 5-hydroxyuridine methyltransferase n=1 Tax=Effusibacillus lacus TaxID=1348429 RepID=A0A292YDL6_9BACL|nr:O-methyltransferase [Effusibacillus lacus]TCS72018.1 putative O-methyltransferase YrrM [Effusibacillus lacus]GAX90312.1 SAM-dependent methyltransferase [Effusibacillus lacus]
MNSTDLISYIRNLVPERDEQLHRMEQRAEELYIPILDLETSQLLRVLLRLFNPERILEVGSAIGYSAIVMAQSCKASILTIEQDSDRAEEALRNIQAAGFCNRIQLLKGDAFDLLPAMRPGSEEAFDVVFLDAAKGQYPHFLELVLPLLRCGGILFSDNVFFQGLVAGPEHVKHKLRTIVMRLREYNQILVDHPQLETAFVPLGDGLAISVKK